MRQCIHPLRQSRLCVLQGRMIKSIKTKKYRNQKGYFHQLVDEDIVTDTEQILKMTRDTFYWMYMSLLCARCACVCDIYKYMQVSAEAKRGLQIPWSYR